MARRDRWFPITAVVLLAGGAWTAASAVPASTVTGGRIPSPGAGFLAPDFHVETLEGDVLTLSDLRGRPVVVNFWATWCPPCRAEMPALEAAYREHAPEGLEIVGLNATSQDSVSAVGTFVDELGLTFPIGLDPTGVVQRLYQIRAFPTTFFIDREGTILEVVIGGPLAEAHLRSILSELLGESS
ncbi:MAG TPA: TlpA disulfide reductase family protein [Anaerolineales bacterium]|nr:TlpA disulfide reductase family protein [Anaerolineales bacterium]